MDLISVIIPYYKKKKFIKETVNSVLKQTYKNLEILLIYDDPDREDLNYIKYIKSLDKKIKLIINNKNYGAGISRNIGIKRSKGKFIAFLDSDDTWDKDKLKKQINFLKKKKANICHTSYKIINDKNKIIGYRKAKNYKIIQELIKSCDIGLSTVMLKRSLIDYNCKFPNLKTKEDFVLWLKILKKNNNIVALKKFLTTWRSLDDSLSASVFQKLMDGFKVYHTHLRYNFFKSLFLLLFLCINYLKKS